MKKLLRENAKAVKELWPNITGPQLKHLQEISNKLMFSVRSQDVLLLNGSWYVTHAGLLNSLCGSSAERLSRNYQNPSGSQRKIDGCSKPPSSRASRLRLWGMATLIPRTSRTLCKVLKCGLLRLAPSTVLFARPTASGFAPLRKSARLIGA